MTTETDQIVSDLQAKYAAALSREREKDAWIAELEAQVIADLARIRDQDANVSLLSAGHARLMRRIEG